MKLDGNINANVNNTKINLQSLLIEEDSKKKADSV